MPDAKKHLAGKEPESAALLNALNQLGSCSSDLCTEEMLFGLGGGLGLIYFLFDLHGGHPIVVGTRYHASEAESPVFVMQMCEAWGATTELKHSSSRSAATKSLMKSLDDGFTPNRLGGGDETPIHVSLRSPKHVSHDRRVRERRK
ncbi:MAG: BtrH N-terminal domain-containing protein [Pyrinomonadaceae bacterium]